MRMHGYGGRAVAVSAGFRSAIFATTASAALLSSPVTAAVAPDVPPETLTAFDLVMLVMLIGTVSFAVISAIALMRARNRAEIEKAMNDYLTWEIALVEQIKKAGGLSFRHFPA
ncbi:MAG: hypothetical protein RLO48_16275 [Bauldia litoralis]